MNPRVITANEAAELIHDGATIATAGFIGIGFAEALAKALEKRFLKTGTPTDLSLVYAAGQGDAELRGLNHFGHEKLIRRVIGGHWGLAPSLGELALQNKIEAYNLPQGVICHLFRDIAAGKPGTITHVGLNTFVDPDVDGGRVNSCSTDAIVEKISLNGTPYLFYKAFPIDIAFLRGTTADSHGNISMEHEALPLEALAIAQAVRNSGGKVIVQVERVTERHQLTPDRIRIPGILVDHVVVADRQDHPQTFAEQYNPAYSGEININSEHSHVPLSTRKVIARRALMELGKDTVVNLGIGMPELISMIAAEEKRLNDFTLTVEPGGIGGQPAGGLSFGAVANADAIIDQPSQFDFYDGGGLHQAFLGMAEVDSRGCVNVSRFGRHLAGCGGFINISQNTPNLYFLGNFTSSGQEIEIHDNRLEIKQNGKITKFRNQVEQITFNGQFALEKGQNVLFITERAVFKLTPQGVKLIEIAPGVDIQKDILDLMEFKPIIEEYRTMDPRLFNEGPMHVQHVGSMPMSHMRDTWKRMMDASDNSDLA
ncbi:CoA-transferase [Neptunomonas sp. XY-337]|uniref:acyl CoA:acetate/3-ketoacid CoA transferase n=1 Tax=Neptunomonas sp. XY-337 TaxID=2561897 RepID=UPI0010AA93E3|nr:CoA-transferase [Neptunomonas sp. XY-337]